jgi:predicted lactoylglutathione lyase
MPMPRMIFVNLPVTDLARSIAFYEAAGATQNPKFSDDKSMCMVFSDTIYVMLLTHEKFAEFTRRPIADAHATVQTLLCLSADSRDHVDSIVETAAAAGGNSDPNPKQDYGFMYNRSLEDPDGHIWEIMWMDPAAAEQGAEAFEGKTA